MGQTSCKACGCDKSSSVDFGAGSAPKSEAERYQLQKAEAGLEGFDPLGADPSAATKRGADYGAALDPAAVKPGGGAAVALADQPGAAADLRGERAAEADTAALSESYWTSYFAREDAELRAIVADPSAQGQRRRRHVFQTSAEYDGHWLNGERHGFGSMKWPDGATYQGEWQANKAWGKGRFQHCDGDMYTGLWRANMAHGKGIYTHRDGTTYKGSFVDDLQEGHGIESWPDKAMFEGTFKRGKKNGSGVYSWPDQSQYMGEWDDNQINGYGCYIGSDGRKFHGKWKASAMHGCGRYNWIDGRTYAGQYESDQKDGFGTFIWADGRRYEGFWKKGGQHGQGRLCHEGVHGFEMRLAEWANGERQRWLGDPVYEKRVMGAITEDAGEQ